MKSSGSGGRLHRVVVTGRGVVGEQAVAIAAIHVELDHVQDIAVVLPAPADLHQAPDEQESELGGWT